MKVLREHIDIGRKRGRVMCVLMLLVLPVFLHAAEASSGRRYAIQREELREQAAVDPFSWMIRLYQRYVSPLRGARCPMYPSCSCYAAEALREEGEEGLLLVFDRLLRCGRDLADYPLTFERGRILHLDPVSPLFERTTRESNHEFTE
jgi:putative membrane protein insertion efficiency factor